MIEMRVNESHAYELHAEIQEQLTAMSGECGRSPSDKHPQ